MEQSNIRVKIEVDINPTESEEKVKKAIWNLFGDISTEIKSAQKGMVLRAETKGLDTLSTLRNVLHRDKIRDASRKTLLQKLRGDTLVFYLNKQVAFAGHVSICEAEAESPLGPIKVTIKTLDPQQLINWLSPKTMKT